MNRKLFLGIGVLVWLLATLVFRAAGQLFFLPDEPLAIALLWLLTALAMLGLAIFLFRWQGLDRAHRYEAAVLLVISGLALDALVTHNFAAVFPNMAASAAGSFGAWLMLAYASALLAAVLPGVHD